MPPAAYYLGPIDRFRATSPTAILGHIQQHTEFDTELAQRDAWLVQIATLQQSLDGLSGFVLMEFIVPRIGSRIDAVVIVGPIVFVLEFKVGATDYTRDHRNQVWDYALDLKYFHRASHDASIVPILIATQAAHSEAGLGEPFIDNVFPPALSNAAGLRQLLDDGIRRVTGVSIDPIAWAQAPYKPTPTIIEAARALYAQHSVDEISRSDAGARNLALTSRRIEALIDEARAVKVKIIAFVTGVPGAGKTLVGLNIATKKYDKALDTHAVFLSGNDPLVMVLREALIRDAFRHLAAKSKRQERTDIRHEVKAFIQNVHHFRDAGVRDPDGPPADRVVIFDEAQRAWNREMTSEFMRRKKGVREFKQSEPEFLISYMDRHPDWTVVVCLVGGGQEINRGEAGISAWLGAVREQFADWRVYVSPELTDSEYAAGHAWQRLSGRGNVHEDTALHLAVSLRSFRAENVSAFVKAVLDCEVEDAQELLRRFVDRYPIAVTRNLLRAKRWVREHARGTERYGLVASSGAQRLKPHAIDVRVNVNPVHWFLNGIDDTRSSYYLEDAATEFQVQGLELDWVCVTWDADLRFRSSGWQYHSFLGKRWTNVNKPDRRQYLLNAYRVLLTRARQGMVICVPEGDTSDPTRDPHFYDPTFDYLVDIGIPVLQ
jgi:schlafen family protein